MLTYAKYAALSLTSSSFKLSLVIRLFFATHDKDISASASFAKCSFTSSMLRFLSLRAASNYLLLYDFFLPRTTRIFRHLPRSRNAHLRQVNCAFSHFEQLQTISCYTTFFATHDKDISASASFEKCSFTSSKLRFLSLRATKTISCYNIKQRLSNVHWAAFVCSSRPLITRQ